MIRAANGAANVACDTSTVTCLERASDVPWNIDHRPCLRSQILPLALVRSLKSALGEADSTPWPPPSRPLAVVPDMPSVDGLGDPVFALVRRRHPALRQQHRQRGARLGRRRHARHVGHRPRASRPTWVSLSPRCRPVSTKRVGELITVRVRTGAGAWVYLELRGAHPTDDGTIVIVARDVTDRHRLDFDQGDTGVLRAVMANMHGMVVLVDGDGLIRSINGAVTRLLGYDPELIRGRSIFDYLHPEDRDHVLDTVRCGSAARVDHARRPAPDGRLQRPRRGDHVRVHGEQPARRSGRPQLRDQRPDRHGARRRPQPGQLPRRARQSHRPARTATGSCATPKSSSRSAAVSGS